MTLDPAVFAFAQSRLAAGGWTHDRDVMRLAEEVQRVVEEFEQELEQAYEEASHGGHV